LKRENQGETAQVEGAEQTQDLVEIENENSPSHITDNPQPVTGEECDEGDKYCNCQQQEEEFYPKKQLHQHP
jgi:hypothetical protein